MRSLVHFSVLTAILVLTDGQALAADQAASVPSTAEVLGKLHHSNLKEIKMGEMARDHGASKEVQEFGRTLIKDHTEADAKVEKLAKEERIDLTANTLPAGSMDMPMGAGFDAAFAKEMVADHQKDIAQAEKARDATKDSKLKALLTEILPVLKKHEAIAQRLVDKQKKS
jgi:putative membrane protein